MSIAARCPLTGMLGVAVASSSIAVASRCANVRAGVGAVLSQNVTDPSLGRRALDLMESGKSAQDVIEFFIHERPFMEWRQLVLVPTVGAPAVFSGDRTLGVNGESISRDCAAAGNLLSNPSVPTAMTQAFDDSQGHLAARLLRALGCGTESGWRGGPAPCRGRSSGGQGFLANRGFARRLVGPSHPAAVLFMGALSASTRSLRAARAVSGRGARLRCRGRSLRFSWKLPIPKRCLAKLISFDTTSRLSNLELIHFVRDYLAQHGVDSQVIDNRSHTKATLFASIGPTARPGFLLAGHTDVVPVDGQEWTTDPFQLRPS